SLIKVLKTELGKSYEYLAKKELHIKKLKESENKIGKAAEEVNNSEQQKNKILIYLLIITSLAILVVIFLVLIFNQLNKVKAKEKIIEDKNVQLEYINDMLLEDANIQEEYIGQFFKEISGYILVIKNSTGAKTYLFGLNDDKLKAFQLNK
ncbi:MAG: DUF6377 domain-containing protein, partial [Mucilaginibacter sp.]